MNVLRADSEPSMIITVAARTHGGHRRPCQPASLPACQPAEERRRIVAVRLLCLYRPFPAACPSKRAMAKKMRLPPH